MTRTRLILLAVLAILAAGALIRARMPVSGARMSAEAATEQSSGVGTRHGSSGSGQKASPIAVLTAAAASRDVPITESAVGWVEPIASVAVRPRTDGVIVERAVADGATVRAGDLLFRLDDQALQATLQKDRATLTKDQAAAEQLQADLTRLKTLHGNDDATEQQLEQQQASVDEGIALVAADTAQIQSDEVQLGYTSITAPIDGRVGVVNVTTGALVHASDQTPLLTVTQMAPIRVSFDVPERNLKAFRQAVAATPPAKVDALDPESSERLSSGTLTFIDSSVDTGSGTVTVKADFANADGALWPGEYVRVETVLGVHQDATVIPMAAVQINEKGSYVFLVKADGTVAAQPVTAEESGDTAIIGSGLKPGDHVVVEGQLRLHDGSAVTETAVADNNKATTSAPDATP